VAKSAKVRRSVEISRAARLSPAVSWPWFRAIVHGKNPPGFPAAQIGAAMWLVTVYRERVWPGTVRADRSG